MSEASVLDSVMPYVGELALAVVTALVAWASTSVKALIDTKVKNTQVAGILDRLNSAVWTAVLEVQQTLRPKLAAKTPTGKILPSDQAELLKAAVERAKAILGPGGWADLVRLAGSAAAAEGVVKSHIEGKVYESKAQLGAPDASL